MMRPRSVLLVGFTAFLCLAYQCPSIPYCPPVHLQRPMVFQIDSSRDRGMIFPTIYGTNQPDWNGKARNLALTRIGGNRLTAYNWENSASNARTDWYNQNDGYLGGGDIPAEAVRAPLAAALAAGASAIVTVPMAGYVAADKLGGGDVAATHDYLNVRFRRSLPAKGAPFSAQPDLNDPYVYQDEFVWFLESRFPGVHAHGCPTLLYDLDNEPDLWAWTHPRIHPSAVRYDELLARTIATASAIKNAVPNAFAMAVRVI
jgi:hypothetical protein